MRTQFIGWVPAAVGRTTLRRVCITVLVFVGAACTSAEVAVPTTSTPVNTTVPAPPPSTSTTTTTTTLPPLEVVDLQVDDLPNGPVDRLSTSNAAFLQRVVGAVTGEAIVVDGDWGQQSAAAFGRASAALQLLNDGNLDAGWWREVATGLAGFAGDPEASSSEPTLALPLGAILWRQRQDPNDALFVIEDQYVMFTTASAAAIADSIGDSNPSFVEFDFDVWPSWPVQLGESDELAEGYYDDLSINDCFDLPTAEVPSARRVPCNVPHEAQLLSRATIPGWMADLGRYPSDEEFDRLYAETCAAQADRYRSDWRDDDVNLFMEFFVTVERDWSAEADYLCAWMTYDGSLLTEFVAPDDPDSIETAPPTELLVASFSDGSVVIGVIDKGPGRVDIAVARLAEE